MASFYAGQDVQGNQGLLGSILSNSMCSNAGGASRNKYLAMPTKRSGGMRREEIQLGGHDFAEDFRSVGK